MLLGGFLCLIASMSWGAMFPVANHSFQYIEPFYFTIFRYVSVAIILAIILYFKEGKVAFRTEGKGFLIWFLGTMAFTVYNLFIFWGQDQLGDSGTLLASIMEALMPMISVLIIWFVYRKRPNSRTLGCILIAFVGVLCVITKGDFSSLATIGGDVIPLLALLASVIGWVLYTMGGGKFLGWSILRYSTLTCIYGTITAAIFVAITTALGYVEVPSIPAVMTVKWDLAFMIIFPGIIALLGWNVGVKMINPVNALLFINFVPITTVLIQFIQGQPLTTFDILGIFLVIFGLSLNNILQRVYSKKQTQKKFQSKRQLRSA